jgi:hypothetical protein
MASTKGSIKIPLKINCGKLAEEKEIGTQMESLDSGVLRIFASCWKARGKNTPWPTWIHDPLEFGTWYFSTNETNCRPAPDDRDAHGRFQKTRSRECIAEVKRSLRRTKTSIFSSIWAKFTNIAEWCGLPRFRGKVHTECSPNVHQMSTK